MNPKSKHLNLLWLMKPKTPSRLICAWFAARIYRHRACTAVQFSPSDANAQQNVASLAWSIGKCNLRFRPTILKSLPIRKWCAIATCAHAQYISIWKNSRVRDQIKQGLRPTCFNPCVSRLDQSLLTMLFRRECALCGRPGSSSPRAASSSRTRMLIGVG